MQVVDIMTEEDLIQMLIRENLVNFSTDMSYLVVAVK